MTFSMVTLTLVSYVREHLKNALTTKLNTYYLQIVFEVVSHYAAFVWRRVCSFKILANFFVITNFVRIFLVPRGRQFILHILPMKTYH